MLSKAHPRYESLVLRDKIVKASKEGLLAEVKHLTICLAKRPQYLQKEQCM